ncbi:NADH dehydrogenase [ubiquinone] 1 beta subcomplex subunit 9 [Belonocnema kinseyi]|uniref:NADH dehydrogenase [ubiquinone] 1 beta subcomplex subunit 9 n=1 Tax=Belonocnema kinseyi TaxID=2817044 RepID=UPI00143D60A1|nr:NADH dehydrogenase [ubiquinone] 1 beta subcomplex subunit 9 [Belonocnema kinseyi]
MAQLPSPLISHSQKVCRLYKKILRNIESWCISKHEFRYNATICRSKFEVNKGIKDLRLANKLLNEGEEWHFKYQHPIPKKFPYSVGGCAYQREPLIPDWVLDYWDPWEKAFYPKYFAKREQRKKEYVEFYKKMYGEPEKEHH